MPRFALTVALGVLASVATAAIDHIPTRARGGRVFKEHLRREEDFHRMSWTTTPNSTANWFMQWIDHNDHSKGHFRQRFFFDMSVYNGTGPAQLYIAGEGPVTRSVTGYPTVVAQKTGSAMVTLEHRYYGESLPSPLTEKKMITTTLNVEQAMADFVNFMEYFEITVLRRRTAWYVVGGSYSGGLSAWLKEMYPSRFVAAWSSSGVVHPRFDYFEFDRHVEQVISPQCADAIRNVQRVVAEKWNNAVERAEMLATLGTPQYFTQRDVHWMIADGTAMAVQYGYKADMCNTIVPISRVDPVMQVGNVIKELWGEHFTQNCYYSTQCLSDPRFADQWGNAGYSWVWQTCGQLSWWQIGYPKSLRPQNLTTDYYVDQCRSAFYPDTIGDVYGFNTRYGGAHPKADHVVAAQGSDDPWQTAGVMESLSPLYPMYYAQCSGCGHCGDLMSPGANEPRHRIEQRAKIANTIIPWIRSAISV